MWGHFKNVRLQIIWFLHWVGKHGSISTCVHHHKALTGKLASGRFHVSSLMNTQDVHGGHHWWLFNITKSMVKHSQTLTLHSREQGWINDVGASQVSVKKKLKTAFSRKSGGCFFLGCVQRSVGWFYPTQFNNKCRCLWGDLQETLGGRSAKERTTYVQAIYCVCRLFSDNSVFEDTISAAS